MQKKGIEGMLVSIIVPVYNVALESFKGCMDSLRNQTLKDIEIILVDDCGEMRECVEYAKELTQTDSRVRLLVNETNLGAGASRNKGIAEAKGEYLGFVDADDTVDLDFYERLYERSYEKKFDIIKGEVFDQKSSLNAKIRKGLAQGIPLYELFKYHHWTAIYRTEYIRSNGVGYGSSRVSQDITFLLQASVFASSIATVDGVYYHYDRNNSLSLTHTMLTENVSYYCDAIKERMDFLVQHADYNDPAFTRYVQFNADRLVARVKMLTDSELTNDKCKVSVIVPTYNAEDYLPELIASLQAQTLEDIEMIFVDDGSKDNSGAIINDAMKEDSRISYYYQENAGAGAARNVGVNHARGKYFICLDSDDMYDSNMLQALYEAAEAQTADVVMCYYRMYNYWINEQKENEGFRTERLPLMTAFSGKSIQGFCECFNPRPNNKLYRRKYIMDSKLRYGVTRIANDVFFGYSAMLLAERIVCLPQNLLTVRRYVNPNSITSTRKNYLEQSVWAVEQLWDWAVDKGLMNTENRKQIVRIFLYTALYNSQYGEHEKFWEECCKFLEKIAHSGFPIRTLRSMFNVDPAPTQKRIEELKEQQDSDKEIEMLENKLVFMEKIGNFVNTISVNRRTKTVKRKSKIKLRSALKKLVKKSIYGVKFFLARFWPVTIKKFYNGLDDNKKEIIDVKSMLSIQDAQIKNIQDMLNEMQAMMPKQENNEEM